MGRLHIPTSNTHVQLDLYFHEAQAGTSSFLAAGLFEGVSKNPQKLKAQHWQNVDYANMKQHAQQAKKQHSMVVNSLLAASYKIIL